MFQTVISSHGTDPRLRGDDAVVGGTPANQQTSINDASLSQTVGDPAPDQPGTLGRSKDQICDFGTDENA
ncbi:MAG: hypothetical protein EOM37_19580 [Proteobacteria bacterium]|nr:hypothetical protein [Pseudomonadota bacterium]